MSLTYGSVCSGIEAASVAWHPLGWRPAWFSEIDAYPSAVLAHHYPDVPNHGDMHWLPFAVSMDEIDAPDVLVGGTPCQSFSIAGLRKGISDARGQLTLKYVELVNEIDSIRISEGKPECIAVWENVPGVLSSRDNAFGCFVAALSGASEPIAPGDKGRWSNAGVVFGPQRTVSWRTLDAQHFGLAQRRKRVFVVASARTDFHPAQVLLESYGLRGNPASRREARKEVAKCLTSGTESRYDPETETILPTDGRGTVTHALRAEGFDASEDGTGRGTRLVPVAFSSKDYGSDASSDLSPTLRAMTHRGSHANAGGQVAIAFHHNAQASQLPSVGRDTRISDSLTCSQQAAVAVGTDMRNGVITGDVFATLATQSGDGISSGPSVMCDMQVRRLTPRECERLQGFPDDYTLVPYRNKPASDGPRYKALGNSMAVPCMRWIGRRIEKALDHSWLNQSEEL